MQLDELYPLKGSTLTQIVITRSGKVLLKAVSSSRSAVCPYCRTHSQKRHSVYVRKPQALPCSGTPVQLVLSVHKYFCRLRDIYDFFANNWPVLSSVQGLQELVHRIVVELTEA